MPFPKPDLPPGDPRHDNPPARPPTTDDPKPVREPPPIDTPSPLPEPLVNRTGLAGIESAV